MDYQIILGDITSSGNAPYYISAEGLFPKIPVTVNIDNLQDGDKIVRFWTEQSIAFQENGRNDKYKNEADLLKQAARQNVPMCINEIRGGQFSLVCKVTIDPRVGSNITLVSKQLNYAILGTQPKKEDVRKALDHVYLHPIIYLKSRFEQFKSDGKPNFINGWGISQITNPSATQIWNWKENIQVANNDFQERRKLAASYPESLRKEDPEYYKGLPDFSEKELDLETLQSYGSGLYHLPKRNALTRKWSWIKSSTNDGFAAKCLEILKNVAGGKLPEGWN